MENKIRESYTFVLSNFKLFRGFQLQIEEPTELAITVYQKGSRDRCDSDIMVLLHKNAPCNTRLGELIVR